MSTTRAAAGVAERVCDDRSAEERVRERAAVDRQLDEWRRLRDDAPRRRQLLAELRGRRTGRPELLQFDVVTDGPRSEVVVVRGELLVAGAAVHTPAVRRFVSRWDLHRTPVAPLEGRVVRLAGRAVHDGLSPLLAEARALGLPVSANHVVPMGGVIKGLSGPAPSAAGRPFVATNPGAGGVRVAVLDTGVDARPRTDGWLDGLAHPDNIDALDAISGDGTLDPGAGHGTFVAGIVQQVAPAAAVDVHRVLDSGGMGSDIRIARAMLEAAAAGADIVNLSLGTYTMDDEPPIAMQAALEVLAERHPEVLVVAAAGNDGSDRPCWPAAFPDVVGVAGLSPALGRTDWSNRGDWITCSTVGEGAVSTYVQGRRPDRNGEPPAVFGSDAWACWTGTSFAAPQVAAAVADRCAAEGGTPRQALAGLLEGRPVAPGFGSILEIMTGT
jgi:hypothetical protein